MWSPGGSRWNLSSIYTQIDTHSLGVQSYYEDADCDILALIGESEYVLTDPPLLTPAEVLYF